MQLIGPAMDNGGHRENGRHKADQYKMAQGQWLMQAQPSMKQIMAIMAERDGAIYERNTAISEKKTAIAERDMAFLQRDSAIAERNNAIMERDNAIATLYRESSMGNGNMPSSSSPGFQLSRGVKHMHHPHHPQQQPHNVSHSSETSYGTREIQTSDILPMSPMGSEATKPRRVKRTKDAKVTNPNKKPSKPTRKVKRENEDLNKVMFGKSHEHDMAEAGDDLNKQLIVSKSDWKGHDLGLNQIAYDEATMPAPVCSCTGVFRQCYKWGSGGWQSSCCTTSLSMYPLPAVPNKRHARVGGRKMSGSAYSKLLSRLAAEGYDLSNPIDLKEHWAKHGTNRYITIK